MDANILYRNIVIALGNSLTSDVFKAQLVLSSGFRREFTQQINNLLSLEKDKNCSFNNQKYALVFAQIMANLTKIKATIERVGVVNLSTMDGEYIDYIRFVEGDTNLKRADIKNESINLDVANLKFIGKLDGTSARQVLDSFHTQQGRATSTQTVTPGANRGPEPIPAGATAATPQPQMPNPQQMRGYGGFFGGPQQIPGGNFPLHPRFDPRFYPYRTKPQ